MMYGCQDMEPNRQLFFISVFLIQIISHRQNNADAKVALSISLWQKWNLHQQFSNNCIFPNIQLKRVVNILANSIKKPV